jgi:hypothetical protein
VLLRRVAVLDQSSEPIDIGGRDGKGNAGSHARLARRESAGNPYQDSNVRFYPLVTWTEYCSKAGRLYRL